MRASAPRIAFALALASPPTRIASSTSDGRAAASAESVGNRCIRRSYARSRLASVVFCERIVRTRLRTGSVSWAQSSGRPNRSASRPETSRRRAESPRTAPAIRRPLLPEAAERPAAPPASDAPRAATPNIRSVPSRAARTPPRRPPTAPPRPPRPALSGRASRRARSRDRTAAGNGAVSARFRKRGDRSWGSSGRKGRRPAGFPLEIADLSLELPYPLRRRRRFRPAAEEPREPGEPPPQHAEREGRYDHPQQGCDPGQMQEPHGVFAGILQPEGRHHGEQQHEYDQHSLHGTPPFSGRIPSPLSLLPRPPSHPARGCADRRSSPGSARTPGDPGTRFRTDRCGSPRGRSPASPGSPVQGGPPPGAPVPANARGIPPRGNRPASPTRSGASADRANPPPSAGAPR